IAFLSGFFDPLTCHALFAEKVHPSRDALIRCGTCFHTNVANLVTLSPAEWTFCLGMTGGKSHGTVARYGFF
ncbi:MAG: hypothetical protein IJ375_07535, partial [Oscillospiraceae bacterium]|nr:hypothetical protein [Oscillospiraceae bacterium]